MITATHRELAYKAGRMACRTGKPLTVCPFEPEAELARWFVRGYRSHNDSGSGVSYDDDEADELEKAANSDIVKRKGHDGWKRQPRDPGGKDGGRWVSGTGGLTGQAALAAAPAKLKRAPEGHHGNYDGEELDAPPGAGSARALSEYEGPEYQSTNTLLRGGYRRKRDPWLPPETEADKQLWQEREAEIMARVAEIDKTMAVSRLTDDVHVERVIRHGAAVFGEDAWYGGIIDLKTDDFDERDRQIEVWKSGKRPDLTGLQWRDGGYQSTTADPAVAPEFGKRWTKFNSPLEGEPVVLSIHVPKGTGGIQLSEMGHAAEILLERGLIMEVTADHGVDAAGFRRLDVKVVTDNG